MRASSLPVRLLGTLLAVCAQLTWGKPAYGSSRLLVVLDEKNVPKDNYSQFWSSLEGMSHRRQLEQRG